MDSVFKNNSSQPAYLQLYNYFRTLIISGVMPSKSKLPSIRKCAQTYGVSKTTVESAYVLLETEGCIYSVPQSGFYVSQMEDFHTENNEITKDLPIKKDNEIIYDFTSSAADKESFDFNLWQRYIKSALRTGARLLDYGDPQGEEDLRKALCSYVKKSRAIMCSEAQIVIGAGSQNLLQLLCALDKKRDDVLFMGQPYPKGETIFEDYGYKVFRTPDYGTDFFANMNIKLIYTSPSHINNMGDVLPVSKRIDLLNYAKKNNCLIIEDDFDSEFSYTGHPAPSLQSLDGGNNVVYIGTFSRLLIPSIRISFMVLPIGLAEKYAQIKHLYNQTASKTEQIALCRYISDGHLLLRIKKTKKLYAEKTKLFYNKIKKNEAPGIKVQLSASGFLVSILIKNQNTEYIKKIAAQNGIKIGVSTHSEGEQTQLLFSVSSISAQQIDDSTKRVNEFMENM